MGLVIAPLLILAYLIGLPYGARRVWHSPIHERCCFGSFRDCVVRTRYRDFDSGMYCWTVSRPLVSSIVAAGLAFAVRSSLRSIVVSVAPSCAGNCGRYHHVPWYAIVRNRAKSHSTWISFAD